MHAGSDRSNRKAVCAFVVTMTHMVRTLGALELLAYCRNDSDNEVAKSKFVSFSANIRR